MPTVWPGRNVEGNVRQNVFFRTSDWYLKETWSKRISPFSTWMALARSSRMSISSSSTSRIRFQEARARVVIRKTLENIIREFKHLENVA